MKPYFGKQVIERPRRGSRNQNIKIRDFGKFVKDEDGNPDYEGFTKIPASRKAPKLLYSDCKDFTDVLGPLEGYLRSSCGRLWDDVYSEIAQVLGNAGYALGHIITDHLNVETNTWKGVDGKIYYDGDTGPGEIGTGYNHDFYVEPWTGILRESRKTRRYRYKKEEPLEAISLGDREEYRKVSGIWYHRTWELIEEAGPINQIGTYYKRQERERHMLVLWEKKRQLGKKQLKELGLKNG